MEDLEGTLHGPGRLRGSGHPPVRQRLLGGARELQVKSLHKPSSVPYGTAILGSFFYGDDVAPLDPAIVQRLASVRLAPDPRAILSRAAAPARTGRSRCSSSTATTSTSLGRSTQT